MSAQLSLEDAPLVSDPHLVSYDWILVSTSAGKDSQCALDETVRLCDAAGVDRRRIIAVHCELGRMEWPGCSDLARQQAERLGVPCIFVSKNQGTLIDQIRTRGKWPSPTNRYCTSDQKRAQVRRVVTALSSSLAGRKARKGSYRPPGAIQTLAEDLREEMKIKRQVRVLSVMGMRAAESSARSKLPVFETVIDNRNQRMDVWLPIHGWSVEDVWRRIHETRAPYHWAYDLDGGPRVPRYTTSPDPADHAGMPRLSCSFCIFAPKAAAVRAGLERPALLAELVEMEEDMGHTFRTDYSLAEVLADIEAGQTVVGPITTWEM